MATCLNAGRQYELKVVDILSKLKYNNQRLNVQALTAAASHDNDVVFAVREKYYGIECKNKGAFEGGGRVLKVINGNLCVEDIGLIKTLYGEHVAFNGMIPSFLKGDRSKDTWLSEKDLFHDEYIHVEPTAISEYYKTKGSSYIQVEGKGLYHTGNDVLEFGVPLFQGDTRLRIRTTKHIDRKTGVPRDVTVALVFKRASLAKSPYCLETSRPMSLEGE